jgi:hypothetical protein
MVYYNKVLIPSSFSACSRQCFRSSIRVSAILLGFSLVVVFYYYEKNNEQKADMRLSTDIVRGFTKDLHEAETTLKVTQNSSKRDTQDRVPNQGESTFQEKRKKILKELQSNTEVVIGLFDGMSRAIKGFLNRVLWSYGIGIGIYVLSMVFPEDSKYSWLFLYVATFSLFSGLSSFRYTWNILQEASGKMSYVLSLYHNLSRPQQCIGWIGRLCG